MNIAIKGWTQARATGFGHARPDYTVITAGSSPGSNPCPPGQRGFSMNRVDASSPWARLVKRRNEIAMTLRHVEGQQQDLEGKAASMDREAHASRLDLLRYLSDWYSREMNQVDQALMRFDGHNSGNCMACHTAISAEKLAVSPQAKFCAGCEEFQQQMRGGKSSLS